MEISASGMLEFMELLNKAQSYIMEGNNVSEAGFMVGYNSSA